MHHDSEQAAGRQGARAVAESLWLIQKQEAERKQTGNDWGWVWEGLVDFKNFKAHP